MPYEESRRREWRLTKHEKERILELHQRGESVLTIADALDIPDEEVEKYLKKQAQERAGHLAGGVFLIGLALLLIPGLPFSFWPGILFVLAATAAVSGMAEGRGWNSLQGALWLFGLGIAFSAGHLFLPVLFILIGLSSIIGFFARPSAASRRSAADRDVDAFRLEKRKREDSDRDDDRYQKRKRGEGPAMRLGPDGELIDFVDLDEDHRRDERRR